MVLGGKCLICLDSQSKYKCPKCKIEYCSLACFKSPSHVHDESTVKSDNDNINKNNSSSGGNNGINQNNLDKVDAKYSKLINDPKFQYFLQFESLRVHLKEIYGILSAKNKSIDENFDNANKKLNSLRKFGDDENELVEEFCQFIINYT